MNKSVKSVRWQIFTLTIIFLIVFGSSVAFPEEQNAKQASSSHKVVFQRSFKKVNGKGGFAYEGMRKNYQIEDFLIAGIERTPQLSPWFESEKEFYQSLLRNKRYDVLVVPFQTQLDGVDIVDRLLMSYRLALEIENRTGMRVAPLSLVHFCLGTNARHYDDSDVYALARKLEISHIVWGYSGTREDELGHIKSLDITIVQQSRDSFGSADGSKSRSWKQIDIKPNQLPYSLFEERISELISFLDLPVSSTRSNRIAQYKQPEIPLSPSDLITAKATGAITDSYLFQFMGMLTPPRAEIQRQHQFIRSLVALTDVNPNSPDYSLLKARAYHHLNRRPAALEALKDDQSPGADFLRNVANGNLPQLENQLKAIEPSMEKLFATLEYSWLFYKYTKKYPNLLIEQLLNEYPEWRYFLELSIHDQDPWDVPSNLDLKRALDQAYPVKGFSLTEMLDRKTIQGNPGEIDLRVNMAFQDHTWKALHLYLEGPSLDNSSRLNAMDQLIMFEGIGISNLLKRLNFLFHVQCLPQESLSLCREYLKRYQGHPYFTLMFSCIQKRCSETQQGVDKEIAVNEAINGAVLGLWWYGRQGWGYEKARSVLVQKDSKDEKVLNQILPYKNLLYGIASDYPFFPKCAQSGFMRSPVDLIDWSCCDPEDLILALSVNRYNPQAKELIQEKARDRFLGHPERYRIDSAANNPVASTADQKAQYIELIKQGGANWKVYRHLGELYVADGEYKKAQEVFLSYPGFQKSAEENRVALSGQSYIAGSYLFWRGAYREARPLYEFSAALETGSSASLTSSARIAILDRDFSTAAQYMLRRAKRYDESYAYRDYMSIMHVVGDSDTAWSQFTSLMGRYEYPHIWDSAIVGHRIERTSKKELMSWIKTMAELNQTCRQRSFPALFALMCMMDRPPDIEWAKFVENVDDLSAYDFSNKFSFKGPDKELIGPDLPGEIYLVDSAPVQFPGMIPKEVMKNYYEVEIPKKPFSFYGSFALAYDKIKMKAYAEAFEILRRQSLLYGFRMDMGKPLVSYLVWAGIKSGRIKEIEHFLRSDLVHSGIKKSTASGGIMQPPLEFDRELAVAAYLCATGKNDLAIEGLKRAFNKLPHTEKRPLFSWYQIVEMCEFFYDHSEDKRYVELALKWVRDYQIIAPMYGWAYAFEAKYTQDEQDQLEALAYALYLDPQSSRIANFSDKQKYAAIEWFKTENPFQMIKNRDHAKQFEK